MIKLAIVVALALQACSGRTPSSEQPAESTSGPEREVDGSAQSNASCPARFDYSMQGSTCTQGSHCVYPEAECHCAAKQTCTGVDLGPEQQTWFEWSCIVTDETVLRPDGCPAKVPEQGKPCGQDGQVCHYSPYCGGIQSTGRCSSGSWQLQQTAVSPPPSAEG